MKAEAYWRCDESNEEYVCDEFKIPHKPDCPWLLAQEEV